MRARHLAQLLWDLYLNAQLNRSWWLFGLMALLFAIAAFVVMGQTAAPFIYTIF